MVSVLWRGASLGGSEGDDKPRGHDDAPGYGTPRADALARVPLPEAPLKPDPIAADGQYARHHRKRTILVRRFGRVAHKLEFGPLRLRWCTPSPPAPTPILRALDKKPHRATVLAA